MKKFAMLIDGGFLTRKIGSKADPATAQKISDFVVQYCQHPALEGMSLHRVYYYDAQPLGNTVQKPLGGGRQDFGSSDVYQKSIKMFSDLARLPFFSLRMGELSFRGWRVPAGILQKADGEMAEVRHADLLPDVQQKGVDMRIGLDIAALTLKDHVDVIVLVTGDSDFVPAMKFARREGAQLFLIALGHPIKKEMLEHSDLLLEPPFASGKKE